MPRSDTHFCHLKDVIPGFVTSSFCGYGFVFVFFWFWFYCLGLEVLLPKSLVVVFCLLRFCWMFCSWRSSNNAKGKQHGKVPTVYTKEVFTVYHAPLKVMEHAPARVLLSKPPPPPAAELADAVLTYSQWWVNNIVATQTCSLFMMSRHNTYVVLYIRPYF